MSKKKFGNAVNFLNSIFWKIEFKWNLNKIYSVGHDRLEYTLKKSYIAEPF